MQTAKLLRVSFNQSTLTTRATQWLRQLIFIPPLGPGRPRTHVNVGPSHAIITSSPLEPRLADLTTLPIKQICAKVLLMKKEREESIRQKPWWIMKSWADNNNSCSRLQNLVSDWLLGSLRAQLLKKAMRLSSSARWSGGRGASEHFRDASSRSCKTG